VTEESVWQIGPLGITSAVCVTWAIMLALALASWLSTRRLRVDAGPWQAAVEGFVGALEQAVRNVVGAETSRIFPFVATLWIFVVAANLSGLIPGVDAPTSRLAVTAALAIVVFGSVHWYGIRIQGARGYVRHYLAPVPLMLPFHVIGEITRTLALAVRLFGNMMSLEMAAVLVLLVGGFLVPVPLLVLHVIEALVQAYIFGMLALIYIGGSLQSQREIHRAEGIRHE
jgi:F-type H+-transporting ATPase subunit a